MEKLKHTHKYKSPFIIHIITALSMVLIMTVQIVICALFKETISLFISVAFNMIWTFILGIFVSNHIRFLMEAKILEQIKENNPKFANYKDTKGNFQEEEIEPFEFFKENIKESKKEENQQK